MKLNIQLKIQNDHDYLNQILIRDRPLKEILEKEDKELQPVIYPH